MPKRYLGNIITDTPTAPAGPFEDSAASGVWSLAEANAYTAAGLWPTAGNLAPRGVFGLGLDNGGAQINVINKIEIGTTGDAVDFGDLSVTRASFASLSSATRAIFAGGIAGSASNVIDYKEFSSTGNAADFGDISQGSNEMAGSGSDTRGVFSVNYTASTEYITYASTGNSASFGDFAALNYSYRSTAVSSNSRVVFCGNGDASQDEIMEYFTIASTGNATDFGDLVTPVGSMCKGQASSGTRGIVAGGEPAGAARTNVIQYITIASAGNSTDFGDLSILSNNGSACSSTTRGVLTISDGDGVGVVDTIEYITIASAGNSTDFGDLTQGAYKGAGCSNAHGGLAA